MALFKVRQQENAGVEIRTLVDVNSRTQDSASVLAGLSQVMHCPSLRFAQLHNLSSSCTLSLCP